MTIRVPGRADYKRSVEKIILLELGKNLYPVIIAEMDLIRGLETFYSKQNPSH